MKTFTQITSAICLACLPATVSAQEVRWDMQSVFSGSLPQLGTGGQRLTSMIETVSAGEIALSFEEPGAIVPALELFDAIGTGAIQAGWSTSGYWTGQDTSLALFSSVPFGPRAGEFYAWIQHGGGKELFEEVYHEFNIHSVICGVYAPEASGWFREPIESVEDFEGLRMRFFGLGARVMDRLGVSTQLLAPGDIFPALELGTIDATEFAMPAIDQRLGFQQVAQHYYFPGWHQQSTLQELMINLDEWNALTEAQQAQIEIACAANVAYGLAEGEALQAPALEALQAEGVTLETWSPEILDAMRTAWGEVVEEERAANPNFDEVWQSLAAFRESYAIWGERGYLD